MPIQSWIAMREGLMEEREVLMMSTALGRSRHEVVGRLYHFWTWADKTTDSGVIEGLTPDRLDEIIGHGFTQDMMRVGWLEFIESTSGCAIIIPEFKRWMGRSSKKRLKDAQRSEKKREQSRTDRDDRHANSVTPSSSSSSSSSVTSKKKSSAAFKPPTLEELAAYVQSKGWTWDAAEMYDHYQANGWRVGRNPMKNWKAAASNWNKRRGQFAGLKPKQEGPCQI